MERRFIGVFSVFVFVSFLLFSKIFYLAVFKNNQYEKAVLAQQKAEIEVSSIRGGIYDCNLIPMSERENTIWHINNEPRAVKGDGEASFLMPSRKSQNGICAHLIGYTSIDGKGLSGIEKKYDTLLKSNEGYMVSYIKNAAGEPIKNKAVTLLEKDTSNQKGICLTIDYHIQKATEEVMDAYIQKGAAVVLDAKTFEVLSMVSRPTYDSENISKYLTSENGELLNRALCAYNAGSVFKIITSASAIENMPYYVTKEFFCDGNFKYGEKTFLCHKNEGHKRETFSKAFADSCNCAFYETALALGGKKISDTAKKFGLGEAILQMNKEEASGFIPRKKEYNALETINLGIGQGDILITPLQVATIVATVANGGVRKDVRTVKGILEEGEKLKPLPPPDALRVIKETTSHAIGNMMRECVLTGTAKSIAESPLEIAGKTGSAETGWLKDDGTPMVHGWFCGFFPYKDPKYAVAVFCEDGQSGAKSCVEPFLKICERAEEIYPFKQ